VQVLKQVKSALGLVRHGELRKVVGLSRAALAYYNEPEIMPTLPAFLQVEPTIYCNLECAFCINPFLPRTRTSMSADNFERLLDQVPTTTKISLVGIGESFMSKELWEIIRRGKARGLAIGTTSNGTILTDRILQQILDSDLDWLNFSIDGATKETYEQMRPGATFEKMLDNIRRIVTALRERGGKMPELAIWFLSNRENVRELPDMVPLVQSLGINSLNTQGVHYWGSDDWHQKATDANAVDDLVSILLETKRRADAAGMEFQWHNFPDAAAERVCKWPWKGAYITADGFVTPCCENGSNPERINFGNVFEQQFVDIWNSEKYQQFRRDLQSPTSRPDVCVDCPSYHKGIDVSAVADGARRR
jgi:radical SAM protein with 4Fe4S-binding SPASM domain